MITPRVLRIKVAFATLLASCVGCERDPTPAGPSYVPYGFLRNITNDGTQATQDLLTFAQQWREAVELKDGAFLIRTALSEEEDGVRTALSDPGSDLKLKLFGKSRSFRAFFLDHPELQIVLLRGEPTATLLSTTCYDPDDAIEGIGISRERLGSLLSEEKIVCKSMLFDPDESRWVAPYPIDE